MESDFFSTMQAWLQKCFHQTSQDPQRAWKTPPVCTVSLHYNFISAPFKFHNLSVAPLAFSQCVSFEQSTELRRIIGGGGGGEAVIHAPSLNPQCE